ncbi:PREDICTED: LYR motif-containing protein 4 [Pygoscelis adeliae]|uniref:LYR motif-containing protein 4 n=2 Tax=Neoaves TaxID=3078114 RepID=UPI0004F4F157|nr:PREDICTED: LYR motif-containing protein 4 [Pygoscelis adeliae]
MTDWINGLTGTSSSSTKGKILLLERNNTMHQCMLGPDQQESTFAEKDLTVQMDDKWTMSQSHATKKSILPIFQKLSLVSLFLLDLLIRLRTYAIRRIRDAFRENKNIKDSEKIEELVNKAKANLEVIHRQVTIGQLYSTQKLVIESPGNT